MARRLVTAMVASALLLGGTSAAAMAEGLPDQVEEKFTQPITFWIQAAETIEFLPVEHIEVAGNSDASFDLGTGCVANNVEESANRVLVVVDDASGLSDAEVLAIFPERVKKRSVIFDVTFVEYCFSATDGQFYSQFDGTLIRHPGPTPVPPVVQLPWPFDETLVGDNAWHNHDTPGTCASDHSSGHSGPFGHVCGFGDSEGAHESDDAYAQDWNWMFGSPPEESMKRVLSTLKGTVLFAGANPNLYGNQVIVVSEDQQLAIRYTHLGSVDVADGQPVEVGDPLGIVGNTSFRRGFSQVSGFPPHLHVALYDLGEASSAEQALSRLDRGLLPCGRGPLRDDNTVIQPTECAQPFRFSP